MSITHTSLTGCGIAASALALLVACGQSSAPVSEAQPIEQRQPQAEPTLVQAANYTYTRTCDGSAAALLPDGRIVIGNDEDSVLRVYNLTGGAPAAEPDLRNALKLVSKKGEADIEAAAVVGDRIYWVTSHGLNSSGELELDRYRFFATATDANGVAMPTVFRDDLLKDPKFPSVDNAKASEAKPGEGGWNIEAMAPGPNGSLLFGFRSPLTDTPSGSAM